MKEAYQRRHLFRWAGWFFLICGIILLLIQLCFLKYLPHLRFIDGATAGKILLTYLFLFASYVTQASIFAFSGAIIALLIAILFPWRWLIFLVAIVLASLLIALQIGDLIVYSLYQSHEIVIGIEVIKSGALAQVIPLSSKEDMLLLSIVIAALLIQWGIAQWTWRRIIKNNPGHAGITFSVIIIVCVCFSYGMMASVLSIPYRHQINDVTGLMLLKVARYVPYYPQVYALIMPINNPHARTIIKTPEGPLTYQTQPPTQALRYPLTPLHCSPTKPLPNIVWLVIDTWRFDAMNKTVTPNIYRFAKKAWEFKNHWSGGNCTSTGIFSLFYGIPGNYWGATVTHHQAPILMDTLQKNQYQLAIYASATLNFPAFQNNIFANVPNLRKHTRGKNTIARDKQITKVFIGFLKKRSHHHPFFSFIFYDAPHNYCGGGKKVHQFPFKPAVKQCTRFSLTKNSDPRPYKNRYNNAVYFVDQQIEQIFNALEQQHLDNNTIVIITSDHGEQINDEKLGYWSHNSAYSPYQLHVPMLVYWPGKTPHVVSYFSTHFDVVPTLMQAIFNCNNPTRDYSVGHNLFIPKPSNYMICSNYTSYAVVTKKRNTIFYPNGAYTIRTIMNRQIPKATLDTKIIRKANKELDRYKAKE